MNKAITLELQFFMVSILWGALILLAYDGLRIIRRLIRHNSIIIAIQDLLFWISASIFIFAMIYVKNNGTIRGFSVMGMGIGMVLYHYILSDLVVKLVTGCIQFLLRPVKFFLSCLKKLLHLCFDKAEKLSGRLIARLKMLLTSVKISVGKHKQSKKAKAAAKKAKKFEVKNKMLQDSDRAIR